MFLRRVSRACALDALALLPQLALPPQLALLRSGTPPEPELSRSQLAERLGRSVVSPTPDFTAAIARIRQRS